MRLSTRFAHTLVATAIACTLLVTVGLTAPADSAFTISIHPVLATLGIDVDVKLGGMHVHFAWSAIPRTGNGVGPGSDPGPTPAALQSPHSSTKSDDPLL